MLKFFKNLSGGKKAVKLENNVKSVMNSINTMLCSIKVNSIKIELTVHISCYCVLDLLCVTCELPWQFDFFAKVLMLYSILVRYA